MGRELMKVAGIMFGIILFAVLFFTLGFSDGKHAADHWYAANKKPAATNRSIAVDVDVWNTILGEQNTIMSPCDDCVIIGKGISIGVASHLLAASCSKETNGTVISGVYRFEEQNQFILLICSRSETGYRWQVQR